MKKMLYTIIFLIILCLVVFAGCVSFVGPEDETTSGGDVSQNTTLPETTAASNPNETTTSKNGEGNSSNTTETPTGGQQPETTQPVHVSAQGDTEYDILRSGSFYMRGTMVDASGNKTPMDMAITDKSVYALSDFDGVEMGVLVNDGDIYLIYPPEKTYLEMSSLLMSMMGMSSDELINTNDLGFENFQALSAAEKVEQTTLNGTACQCYTFPGASGVSSKVYMNGTKLLRFESYDAPGRLSSACDVDYITGDVPAEKINPSSSYKKSNIYSFMKLLSGVLDVG